MQQKTRNVRLIDALEMSKEHPETFHIPTKEEINKIKKGSTIKVSDGKDRFWSIVKQVIKNDKGYQNMYQCEINNQLVNRQKYNLGDLIFVNGYNIYQIYEENDAIAKMLLNQVLQNKNRNIKFTPTIKN